MAMEPFQLKPLPLIDPDEYVQRYLHFWQTATDAQKQAVLDADADKRRKEEQDNESKSE